MPADRMTDSPWGFLRANARWLAAGALLAFASSFGQTYFIAVFAGAIRGEFGLSHSAWGAIYGAGTLISAGLMVGLGGVADRMPARVLGSWVLAGLACACLAMAALPGGWALVPVILALRFAGQGMSGHVATTAIARWFAARRGRALAIATLGFAAGEAVLPVVFAAGLTWLPWRSLWLVAAALALLAIPLLRALLQRDRAPVGAAEDTQLAGLGGRHWTRGEALRHPLFWACVPLILGPAAFLTALFFQQVHLAAAKGWSHVEFVALFPLYTGVAIAAMLGAGVLIDRVGTRVLLVLFQIPMIAGFLILSAAQSLALAALALALIAASHGINTTLPTAFWAEHYGTRHLGAIRALAVALMVLGTAIGPALSGVLIDAGIDFAAQMPAITAWLGASSLLAAAGLGATRPPPRPAAS